jgi:poly(3-hydroxybutyrate) depolymerase
VNPILQLFFACVCVSGLAAGDPAAQPTGSASDPIVLREALVLPSVGVYGRTPIQRDAIQALLISDRWSAPRAGTAVQLPDGSAREWEAAAAGDDGVLKHPALNGGYAYFSVPCDAGQTMLLDAAGHSMVYVNGEPRAGDPYQHGYVRLPVRLRAGANEMLFHVGRGSLRAKLFEPKAVTQFDLGDTTLPDLITGRPADYWAAVMLINLTSEPIGSVSWTGAANDAAWCVQASLAGGEPVRTALPLIAPLTVRKVGFRVRGTAAQDAQACLLELKLLRRTGEQLDELDSATISLRVRRPDQTHKRTFRSDLDGSVQYYAVVPAAKGDQQSSISNEQSTSPTHHSPLTTHSDQPALILTLHGASVEAIGQADAYLAKSWAHVVAPTNRRPFGFDWEDWGRLDAIEVLRLAERELGTDPRRTYLTGHSMGGHGVWHLGATFPDRFAAIGPSAGWVSMWSYAGARREEAPSPVEQLLQCATTPGDTLALARNYAHHGVYVLHGEKDDNVPVAQARTMKQALAGLHKDFAYHEEPGMGHWWGKEGIPGTACVDWPPMWEFFQRHTIPRRDAVREIDFLTASPGVSAWSHWVGIETQIEPLKPSSVSIRQELAERRFIGTTKNVARLALDLDHVSPGKPVSVELDGQGPLQVAWPAAAANSKTNQIGDADAGAGSILGTQYSVRSTQYPAPKTQHPARGSAPTPTVRLQRIGERWVVADEPAASLKGPHRYGPFKEAFRNRMLFVYGTRGTPEENAWAAAKARYDAETFWYRGNGSVDVMSDWEFEAECASVPLNPKVRNPIADRNVILYGNADSNVAWEGLLKDSPAQVRRARVEIGDRVELGDDLGCLFVRPRPGSDIALVGVVSGSGVAGMRLTDRLPYFISGVAYPDCIVLGPETLDQGMAGVRAAGFFATDWGVASGQFAWSK